jgi:L-fucose isomerase-like protein
LIGKRLGGASLYCELDAIDEAREAFLCANTGEGDFDWCPREKPCRIFSSGSDSGRFAPGCSVKQILKPGPATMIGFSPRAAALGGFSLIAMEGEVLDPPEVALSVTSAWFRAEKRPMRKAMAAWIQAGATHHGSLSPGHLAEPICELAAFLGIGFERI